ncbi:MAG TPA: iron-sulfur cluster assembly accessory protein [Candidatus Deferrimicrobium sp.]|nr:iron-sulfur cluster assembly accessory protein [Candidatus Deferrimicrobium sp.]
MIEITDKAIRELKRILLAEGEEGKAIRIFTVGGGCCGPALEMAIVDKGEEDDVKFENKECAIFIQKRAFDELNGAKLDYIDEGAETGFSLSGLQKDCCKCES